MGLEAPSSFVPVAPLFFSTVEREWDGFDVFGLAPVRACSDDCFLVCLGVVAGRVVVARVSVLRVVVTTGQTKRNGKENN